VEIRRRIDAALEQGEQAKINFLRADLQLGLTFCHLAKSVEIYSGEYARRVQVARRALEVCRESLWIAKPDPHELDQLTAQLEHLRFEVMNLGPTLSGESDDEEEVSYAR
jgi:hypothetical protein